MATVKEYSDLIQAIAGDPNNALSALMSIEKEIFADLAAKEALNTQVEQFTAEREAHAAQIQELKELNLQLFNRVSYTPTDKDQPPAKPDPEAALMEFVKAEYGIGGNDSE